jgi:pyruvate carboxylase
LALFDLKIPVFLRDEKALFQLIHTLRAWERGRTLEGIRDMTEEIVDNAHQESFCADLLALKSCEAFPVHLLIGKRTGEWVRVRDLCLQIGVDAADVSADLVAAWLSDPAGNEGNAVILFYDEDSLWSMAANYNRQRLLDVVLPTVQRQAG